MGLFDGIFKRDKKQGPPDFSGVQGGGSSTASSPATATADPPEASGEGRTYVVVKGDSLSRIAERQYGDANKWRKIYEANRDLIKDPDLIYPGQSFRIPQA